VSPEFNDLESSNINQTVIIDQPVVVDCSVTGIPHPDILWYKNEREIARNEMPTGMNLLYNGRRLEISSADLSDAALYKCVAKNPAGTAQREFKLNVWSKYFNLLSKLYIHTQSKYIQIIHS